MALDSSTETASVALLRDAVPLAEYSWRAAGRHTAGLLPALHMLCRDAGVAIETWTAVAVATGPGSFNGIRSGIAAAMGLAMSREIPLVGVATLDVFAYGAFLERGMGAAPLVALLPAGRGALYYATYLPAAGDGPGSWAAAARGSGPRVATAEDLAPVLRDLQATGGGSLTLCGTLSADDAGILHAALQGGIALPPSVAPLRRASYLALLAERYLDGGGEDQLLTVTPLYLRRVTVTRSRRSLSGASAEQA